MKESSWKKKFKTHEASVLESFISALSPLVQKKIIEQINSVKVVRRIASGEEVNMYSRKLFKPIQLDCEYFSGMDTEQLVASLTAKNNSNNRVNIWFVEGRPFSLEYSDIKSSKNITDWLCELKYNFEIYEKLNSVAER